MIYTLTMNPSIDYVVGISNFMAGELNRTSEEDVFPGGKGLNVSVVLKHLGIDNKAIFFAGGFTGDELVRLLEKEGVSCKALPVSNGFTRINVKIKGNKETEINGLGPNLTDEDIKRLYALLDNVKKEFLDIGVTRRINDEEPENIHDLDRTIEIEVGFDMTDKEDFKLVREHDGEVLAFASLSDRPTDDYVDGTVYFGENVICIYSRYFSTYVLSLE